MLKDAKAFSSFSVDSLTKAKEFYGETLGLEVKEEEMDVSLNISGMPPIFIYEKPDHKPATFTILNFKVSDIDQTVDEMRDKGIVFEKYPDMPQDEKGILRSTSIDIGPNIAWFQDPAGNILSVIQES